MSKDYFAAAGAGASEWILGMSLLINNNNNNVLRANRECTQLTSCTVIIADYVFACDVLIMYMLGYWAHCS